MGIIVKSETVRKKHKEHIKIAIDGKEVYGMKEEKYWEPTRTIEYYPVLNPKVKEKVVVDKGKEEVIAERIGWSKFDDNLKKSFHLHNRSRNGRILLRGGDGKFWNIKTMKYEGGLWKGEEKKVEEPKIKMLYPVIGQVVNVRGRDYYYIGKTKKNQWRLRQGSEIKKVACSQIKKMIKKMELHIVENRKYRQQERKRKNG